MGDALESLEEALQCAHRTMQRQTLLKMIWRLTRGEATNANGKNGEKKMEMTNDETRMTKE